MKREATSIASVPGDALRHRTPRSGHRCNVFRSPSLPLLFRSCFECQAYRPPSEEIRNSTFENLLILNTDCNFLTSAQCLFEYKAVDPALAKYPVFPSFLSCSATAAASS